MVECIEKDKKFFRKFSPGCAGRVEYGSGMLEPTDRNKPFGKMRTVKGKTCYLHHLENEYGLVALECPKCKKQDKDYRDRIQSKTDMAMEDPSKYTYISMDLAFAPARHTWYLRKTDIPAFTIRCWFCGFIFWKGRRATKAEREKNEKQAIEEIPEMSEKMRKAFKSGKKL